MPRYFLHLSYDGARYRGWQTQHDVATIQQTVEQCLSQRYGRQITIHGCGRTDAEVHATQYFAHVDLEIEPDKQNLLFVLNKMLPDDIVLHDVIAVAPRSNAQRHTKDRTYIYRLHGIADPFVRKYSWHYPGLHKIDSPLIDEALDILVGQHDFVQFCRQPLNHSSTLCTIYRAEYHTISDHGYIVIKGDRFLRSMVRIIVHTLLELGSHRLELTDWTALLSALHTPVKVRLAPPQGLYLAKVEYPSIDLPIIPQVWPATLKIHSQNHTYD